MRVTLIQMDIRWGSPEENRQQAELFISKAVPSDLYVLPEMWSTGFVMQPELYAEDEVSSSSLAWMKKMAYHVNGAICGSLAIRSSDGTFRNRHYFVTPESVTYYDKHHLFTPGHESEHYTAGFEPVIVNWRSFRFLLQTCYDLRFPVFSRYGRAGEYDAIIYVANWPAKRQLAWEVLLRARAIENQCYVIGVNRVGNDSSCRYQGDSSVFDPTGQILLSAGKDVPCAANTVLDIDRLIALRERFKVLSDRD